MTPERLANIAHACADASGARHAVAWSHVRTIPNAAFKVWMAYWMHESDGQEAYPEMETLVLETGISESTIRRARAELVETDWLIRLEGSAGSRYTKASSGSWNIGVYRVNDPTSVKMNDPSVKMTELEGESVKMTDHANFTLVSILTPNVASTGTSAFTGTTTVPSTAAPTLATPHTPCEREGLAPPKNSLREERPAPSEARPEEQQPVSTPPITTPPPTQAEAKFQCPACDLTHRKGYHVAEHIEKEHPELGEQSFKIPCPVDGCIWRTWWNKVNDNEAAEAAKLADHLDVQHNPDSPRFAPMDACGAEGCYTVLPRSEMAEHRLQCKKVLGSKETPDEENTLLPSQR